MAIPASASAANARCRSRSRSLVRVQGSARVSFLISVVIAVVRASTASSLSPSSSSAVFSALRRSPPRSPSSAAWATPPRFDPQHRRCTYRQRLAASLRSPSRATSGGGGGAEYCRRSSFASELRGEPDGVGSAAGASASTIPRVDGSVGPPPPWAPPSQIAAPRPARVFEIRQPQDLLDFVIEDERLSVVKVYASWCKTCQVFDVRYRKLASQLSDKYENGQPGAPGAAQPPPRLKERGRVRFAQMRYDDPNNEEMCKLLNATKVPYILIYKGTTGKVAEFQSLPAHFQRVIDTVNEFADPVAADGATAAAEISVGGGGRAGVPGAGAAGKEDGVGGGFTQALVRQKDEEILRLSQQLQFVRTEMHDSQRRMQEEAEVSKGALKILRSAVERERKSSGEEVSRLSARIDELEADVAACEDELAVARLVATRRRSEAATRSKADLDRIADLERRLELYECERNSIWKLSKLAMRRVFRGVGSLPSKIRRRRPM